jgi:hypothetical protein
MTARTCIVPATEETEQMNRKERRAAKRESVDILKPMKLTVRPEESGNGLFVFHVTSDAKLVAVITVDHKTASVHPVYHLPEWAARQMTQAALDMMLNAAGEPAGDPAKLRQIKSRPAH